MEATLAVILLIFTYIGCIPLIAVVNRQYPTQASGVQLPLITSAIYGLLLGLLSAIVGAHPVEGAGISFAGNGMLGFIELAVLTCLALLVTLLIRRAWIGAVLAPLLFLLVFCIAWWGFGQIWPPFGSAIRVNL